MTWIMFRLLPLRLQLTSSIWNSACVVQRNPATLFIFCIMYCYFGVIKPAPSPVIGYQGLRFIYINIDMYDIPLTNYMKWQKNIECTLQQQESPVKPVGSFDNDFGGNELVWLSLSLNSDERTPADGNRKEIKWIGRCTDSSMEGLWSITTCSEI